MWTPHTGINSYAIGDAALGMTGLGWAVGILIVCSMIITSYYFLGTGREAALNM
jgi:hypothetical protein